MTSFNCPACHAKLNADPAAAGTDIQCPACGAAVRVPGDAPAPPAPPPPPSAPPPRTVTFTIPEPRWPTGSNAVGWAIFALLCIAEFITLMNSFSYAQLHYGNWFAVYVGKFMYLSCDMCFVGMATAAACIWMAADRAGNRQLLPVWIIVVLVFRPLGLLCYMLSRSPSAD